MKINTDKHSVTVIQLKEWVEYNPTTGKMYRIKGIYPKTGQTYIKRKEVTGTNNRGYLWLKVFGTMYLVHRLVFLYMNGEHPETEVDHINGIRTDNRWKNLRQVTPFQNSRNQGIRKDCTSGVRGVNYCSLTGKWIVRISHMGVRYGLGNYRDKGDAIAARLAAEIKYGYHPNHAKRQAWCE